MHLSITSYTCPSLHNDDLIESFVEKIVNLVQNIQVLSAIINY